MKRKPVLIDDILKYKFMSDVQISSDGKNVSFIVKQASADQGCYISDIYIINLINYKINRLTNSGKIIQYFWVNRGQEILYIERNENDKKGNSLYKATISNKAINKICLIPRKVLSVRNIDDSTLLYTAWVNLNNDTDSVEKDYHVLDEIPFWKNGKGFRNKCRVHLFLYNIKNKEEQELVKGYNDVTSYDYMNNQVIYSSKKYKNKENQKHELWILDLSSKISTCVSYYDYLIEIVHFLNNETVVILGTDMKKYGIRQSREVLSFNLKTKHFKNITPGWDRMIGNFVNSDCRLGLGPISRVKDNHLYLLITEGYSCYLDSINKSGKIKRVISANGSVDSFDVLYDKVVFISLREDKLQEVYLLKDNKEYQLTYLNKEIMSNREISIPKHFTFRSKNGEKIDSWIIKPFDFIDNRKYPAILMIHGGPKTVYGSIFFHELQVLTAQGYTVFYCNPHGSAGKGDAFADIHEKYGEIDYEDIMSLVDHTTEKFPFIDKNRLGVMGGSYGGFMTNWIIAHSNIFNAACSQRGISNWISKFCSTETGYFINADRGTPWEEDKGKKLWWHSPLCHADKVKTPLLLVHSEEDYNVTFFESIQMFTALRYHGVESKLVLFSGENHNLSRAGKPRNRISRLLEILSWFKKYLESQKKQ